jgi:hypothetical protein
MRVNIPRHGKRTVPRPADARARQWATGYGQVAAAIRLKTFLKRKAALREARELCDDVINGME